ncbi:sulfite exporter TauE/SafE family protein [Pseudaestuariivita rosea]|uniref:sulfite exporter TauE/SafE family protein n=1 Tax=Pseudaestuariivita rosea TaxID=2763263 RepID=UPI001ABB4345|nr:sulfite exporter TauE/SafE family protein [Pseudaestuariivita rosea]
MDLILPYISVAAFAFAMIVAFTAGFVKGIVGFAMPMIIISGLASVVSPELALAGLIFPTLVTNGMQALRYGWRAALASVVSFWRFLLIGLVFLLMSAQLFAVLSSRWLFLLIGIPIVVFSALQLLGWRPGHLVRTWKTDAAVGGVAGFIGGLSGIWGPPTVAYLTALDTPKEEQMRLQGVIYGLGAVALFFAHVQSGVIRLETVPFSLALIVPAIMGMWIGLRLQDQIDQVVFRKITLFVLLIVGLNLIRRGLVG